jgi:hypothetical protein
MLIFNRKEFKSGVMYVDDRKDLEDGSFEIVKVVLKVADKGDPIEFMDEDYVLGKYPLFFEKV